VGGCFIWRNVYVSSRVCSRSHCGWFSMLLEILDWVSLEDSGPSNGNVQVLWTGRSGAALRAAAASRRSSGWSSESARVLRQRQVLQVFTGRSELKILNLTKKRTDLSLPSRMVPSPYSRPERDHQPLRRMLGGDRSPLWMKPIYSRDESISGVMLKTRWAHPPPFHDWGCLPLLKKTPGISGGGRASRGGSYVGGCRGKGMTRLFVRHSPLGPREADIVKSGFFQDPVSFFLRESMHCVFFFFFFFFFFFSI